MLAIPRLRKVQHCFVVPYVGIWVSVFVEIYSPRNIVLVEDLVGVGVVVGVGHG